MADAADFDFELTGRRVILNAMLICSKCDSPRQVGRKLCRMCYLLTKRESAKQRFETQGRYSYTLSCKACSCVFSAARGSALFCKACRSLLCDKGVHTNQYEYDPESFKATGQLWKHRAIAESILGRKLQTHEVVHHMDANPKNNDSTNLLVITRKMHGRLHWFLNCQRVIFEKSKIENIENCWNSLIVPMTTTWLETATVKVIKIWEIGQSAAEPLSDEKTLQVEGSETMHDTPDHLVEGEDIVQTTTERAGEIPE